METEVVNYIKEAKAHGLSDLEIKQNLLNVGWDAGVVEESFSFVKAADGKLDENKNEDVKFTKPVASSMASQVLPAHLAPQLHSQPQNPVAASILQNITQHNTQSAPVQATIQKPQTQPGQAASASKTPAQTQAPIVSPSANPGVAVSEKHFQTSGTGALSFLKKPLLWIILGALIILGGGGFYYYAYGLNSPQKTWEKFTKSNKNTIFENNFKLTYSDKGQLSESETPIPGFSLNDMKVGFDGQFYVNGSDPKNAESTSKIQYTFSSGNTSFSTGFQYMLLSNVLFLKVDSNPFLDNIFKSLGEGKKIEWVKVDIGAIQNELVKDETSSKDYDKFKEIFSPSFNNELAKIWEDAKLVKVEKYVGKEKINGVTALHFKNSIDKVAVKNVFSQYIAKIAGAAKDKGADVKDEEISQVNQVISAIVDKMEVKEFETWIGIKDFKLYRVHFVSNAPSLISLVKTASNVSTSPFDTAQEKSADAKRLADVRQMASALEIYFNEKEGYPEAKDGKPVDLAPNYIGLLPTVPAATGKCSNYYNDYWYAPAGDKIQKDGKTYYTKYELTFCLGNATGGYQAGLAKLTPAGIEGGLPCTGTQEQCTPAAKTDEEIKSEQDKIKEFISKVDFNAEIKADVDYLNYGKKQQLAAPGEYFDILNTLGNARSKSRDAKRMGDVRQLAAALELYFNDKNAYPKTLQELTPTYIGTIPTPPEPNDGSCSTEDNKYSYRFIKNDDYEISFCLGADTGGYPAGKHTLTPTGVK